MKKQIMLGLTLYVSGMIAAAAADMSAADKQFLTAYEQVRAALAADDLAGAKKAASELGENGKSIGEAKSLTDARKAFEAASEKATTLSKGKPGYFVMHCPMVNKDWVQTSDKPNNPYLGKQMLSCGELKK